MKTRVVTIIVLVLAALGILLGLRIGKKSSADESSVQTRSDTLIARRVYNLIILDESGSMHGLVEASVCGVNQTLGTIRKSYEEFPRQEQYVTIATFSGDPSEEDNTCRVRRRLQDITMIKDLEWYEYKPKGLTPLLDAMGKLLTELEEKVTDEDLVLVTIITDGAENSSVTCSLEDIRELVSRLDAKGWTFTYIGANQNAAQIAGQMGIRNSLQYTSDADGTRKMYEKESDRRRNYYKKARTNLEVRRLQEGYFNEEDKK